MAAPRTSGLPSGEESPAPGPSAGGKVPVARPRVKQAAGEEASAVAKEAGEAASKGARPEQLGPAEQLAVPEVAGPTEQLASGGIAPSGKKAEPKNSPTGQSATKESQTKFKGTLAGAAGKLRQEKRDFFAGKARASKLERAREERAKKKLEEEREKGECEKGECEKEECEKEEREKEEREKEEREKEEESTPPASPA
ncbi:hypothetical protein TeGR_g1428, partial [Tetraparma gracilis]